MKSESPGDASGGGRRRVNPRSGGKNPSFPTPALPCSAPPTAGPPGTGTCGRAARPPSRHTHTGRLSSSRRGSAPRSRSHRPAPGQGARPASLRDPASHPHFPAGLKGGRTGRANPPPRTRDLLAGTATHRLAPAPAPRPLLSGRRSAPSTNSGARAGG